VSEAQRHDRPSRGPKGDLGPEDRRLVQQVEDLYGPARWGWGEWSGSPEPAQRRPSTPRRERRSLPSLALRTTLALAVAALSWYVAFGDRSALARVLALPLSAVGIAQPTPTPPETAEYFLAVQTTRIGEPFPPSAAVVGQLKDLLDQLATTCKADRFDLAGAGVAAHKALVSRGVDKSARAILAEAYSKVMDQIRLGSAPNCAEAIARTATTP